MNWKEWSISKVAGPLGFVIKPILAAIVSVFVMLIYQQIDAAINKVLWLDSLFHLVVRNIPTDVLSMLTPQAIGGAAGIAAWMGISAWVIEKLKSGNKQIQATINNSPNPLSVKVDGIIVKNGETSQAISRLAYESLFPDEKANRPTEGEAEVRRPLPM